MSYIPCTGTTLISLPLGGATTIVHIQDNSSIVDEGESLSFIYHQSPHPPNGLLKLVLLFGVILPYF